MGISDKRSAVAVTAIASSSSRRRLMLPSGWPTTRAAGTTTVANQMTARNGMAAPRLDSRA